MDELKDCPDDSSNLLDSLFGPNSDPFQEISLTDDQVKSIGFDALLEKMDSLAIEIGRYRKSWWKTLDIEVERKSSLAQIKLARVTKLLCQAHRIRQPAPGDTAQLVPPFRQDDDWEKRADQDMDVRLQDLTASYVTLQVEEEEFKAAFTAALAAPAGTESRKGWVEVQDRLLNNKDNRNKEFTCWFCRVKGRFEVCEKCWLVIVRRGGFRENSRLEGNTG
ncbi:hypothetical protein V8F06_006117 [Rhypophila decipiens]